MPGPSLISTQQPQQHVSCSCASESFRESPWEIGKISLQQDESGQAPLRASSHSYVDLISVE
jgi:hypothetical protein